MPKHKTEDGAPIEAEARRFEPAATAIYAWERRYSRASVVDRLTTTATTGAPTAQREALLARWARPSTRSADSVLLHYRTNMLRRPRARMIRRHRVRHCHETFFGEKAPDFEIADETRHHDAARLTCWTTDPSSSYSIGGH